MADFSAPPVVAHLEAAAQGLEFPSETDAPLAVFFWPDAAPDLMPQAIAQRAGAKPDDPVETREVEDFFSAATTEEKWMKEKDLVGVRGFQKLLALLQAELTNLQVVVSGENSLTAVVVGQPKEGGQGLAGFTTTVVET